MNKKVVIAFIILTLTSNTFAKEKIDALRALYMQGSYRQAYELCIEFLNQDY